MKSKRKVKEVRTLAGCRRSTEGISRKRERLRQTCETTR